MPSGGLCSSQFAVQSIANWWVGQLNLGSTLRLYTNPITITPALNYLSFVEATFTGYAAAVLTGKFPTPSIVINGEVQSSPPAQTFTCTGGSAQTVFGGYIVDDVLNLWFAAAFPAPLMFVNGSEYSVAIAVQEWALTVVP